MSSLGASLPGEAWAGSVAGLGSPHDHDLLLRNTNMRGINAKACEIEQRTGREYM